MRCIAETLGRIARPLDSALLQRRGTPGSFYSSSRIRGSQSVRAVQRRMRRYDTRPASEYRERSEAVVRALATSRRSIRDHRSDGRTLCRGMRARMKATGSRTSRDCGASGGTRSSVIKAPYDGDTTSVSFRLSSFSRGVQNTFRREMAGNKKKFTLVPPPPPPTTRSSIRQRGF